MSAYIASADAFAREIADSFNPLNAIREDEQDFLSYYFAWIFCKQVDELTKDRNKKFDTERLVEEFSTGIQRIMNLKKLNSSDENPESIKIKRARITGKKRYKAQVDEYDLEYYR